MAGRARRRPARHVRSKAAAAGRPRHPAGVAPVAVAARRAVAAALPPRDWTAVTDVPAPVRPGRCAARDLPPGLMLLLAAERVARPAVDPGEEPASPSGVSAAANSPGRRAAAVAGRVREPADGRYHRRRAVDWLNSPPSPRLHARKSPSKRRVSEIVVTPQQSGSEKAKKQPCAARCSRMLADFRRAAHDFSPAWARLYSPAESDRKQIWRNGGNASRLMLRGGRSAKHWYRQSRTNSTAPRRFRACAPHAARDRLASRPKDCRD